MNITTPDVAEASESPPATPHAFGVRPESGHVLEPGNHLIELELSRSASVNTVIEGLVMMGWAGVEIDQSLLGRKSKPTDDSEWGPHGLPPAVGYHGRVRFAGHIEDGRHIEIASTKSITWQYAYRLARVNPFAELRPKVYPFDLLHGHTYELRFRARMTEQSHATRDLVRKGLETMGFQPHKMSALRRNMRMPGQSGANVTLWLALGTWVKRDSVITRDEPFFFDDVEEIASEP